MGKRTLCVNECTGSMWQGASCVCCDRLTSSWIPFALSGILSLLMERTVDSIQRCPHQMKRDSDINLIQNNLNPSCATDFLNLSYDSLFCFLVALLHIPSTAQREKQPYSVPAKSLYLWVYLGTIADLLFFLTFSELHSWTCTARAVSFSFTTFQRKPSYLLQVTPHLHFMPKMYEDTQTVFHVIAIYPITGAHY